MTIAQSKVTAQGQISAPAKIRKRPGVGPGSVLEWEEQNGQIVVRKAGRHTSADVHRVLFDADSRLQVKVDVKEAISREIHW